MTNYAMDSVNARGFGPNAKVVAGLSNQATLGAARALAAGTVSRGSAFGIVIKLVDTNGDGIHESILVVDSV